LKACLIGVPDEAARESDSFWEKGQRAIGSVRGGKHPKKSIANSLKILVVADIGIEHNAGIIVDKLCEYLIVVSREVATQNGGATWTTFQNLNFADTTVDWSPSGTAYMSRLFDLPKPNSIEVERSLPPQIACRKYSQFTIGKTTSLYLSKSRDFGRRIELNG